MNSFIEASRMKSPDFLHTLLERCQPYWMWHNHHFLGKNMSSPAGWQGFGTGPVITLVASQLLWLPVTFHVYLQILATNYTNYYLGSRKT